MLACLSVAFSGLWMLAKVVERGASPRVQVIFGMAILLRLLALPLAPSISEDALRYVWDGRVLASGHNPYLLAPASGELEPLRDSSWEILPHKEVPTVYPPLAMLAFRIAAGLPGSFYVLKLLLVACELLGLALLISIASRRGLPRGRLVWYAWNPLVVLEVAGMGHVDAIGVAAMIGAVYWLSPGLRRSARAGVAAGLGVLAKLVPLVALPMWARCSARPGRVLLIAVLLVVVGLVPLAWATGGVPPGLVRYAVSWEFNGPLFEPLWRALEWIDAPAGVESLLDGAKGLTGWHRGVNTLYPYNYPQFLAKAVLWILLAVAIGRSLWRREVIAGTGWLMGWVLLCSATVYPWYLLWILPWAALCRQRAWLTLSATIQLSYLPQLLGSVLWPGYYLAVWTPFALALIRDSRWSTD